MLIDSVLLISLLIYVCKMAGPHQTNGRDYMGKLPFIASLCQGLIVAFMLCVPPGSAAFARMCPTEPIDSQKTYKLYLYFPTAPDNDFPSFGHDVKPARPFDVGDLNPGIGTTAQLIDAIKAVVVDDYCEFNVQVLETTTNPRSLNPLLVPRTTVAIGSDGTRMSDADWGRARNIGGGIVGDEDFARVWAGFYTVCEGGAGPKDIYPPANSNVSWDPHPGIPVGVIESNHRPYRCSTTGALTGGNATLEHWAEAIGGSAAHEAGHTYGLTHRDDNPASDLCDPIQQGYAPNPGEDRWNEHLMPSGCNLTGPDRTIRRHFSNRDYGILAANVGLSVETMHVWELVNPNREAAERLDIDVLSPLPKINILPWNYSGPQSPWLDPTVSEPLGTAMFEGKTYNKFRITWSVGNQAWIWSDNGHVFGTVTSGQTFRVGTTFIGTNVNQPDPIIIQNITLLHCHQDPHGDTQCSPLALGPHLPSYGTGTVDAKKHQLLMPFLPPASAPGLRMVSATISQLPQLATIDALVGEGRLFTRDGRGIQPWVSTKCKGGRLRDGVRCVLARLDQKPHVAATYNNATDCGQGAPPALPVEEDQSANSAAGLVTLHTFAVPICASTYRDPFPSATVYVVATFVDPKAKHFDAAKHSYVVGPVASKVYYQFAGIRHLEQLVGSGGRKPN
jgi:hypothetical protein